MFLTLQVLGPGHDLEDFYLYPSVIKVSKLCALCSATTLSHIAYVAPLSMIKRRGGHGRLASDSTWHPYRSSNLSMIDILLLHASYQHTGQMKGCAGCRPSRSMSS